MDVEFQSSRFPSICVVTPVFNEEATVEELVERVVGAFDRLPRSGDHRILLVDDGSHDETWSLIERCAAEDPRVSGVSLSRNFGHQAAVSAGLAESDGDVVIVMDGDLQDDPSEIERMVQAYLDGSDVVYAIRRDRSESPLLRFAYWAHYRIMQKVSRPRIPTDAGDFALMSRRVVQLINQLPERQRYVRGLRAWVGFAQTGIEVRRSPRYAGESKYSISKLVNLAVDGLFSFSIVPIRMTLGVGAFTIVGGLIYGVYALIVRLTSGSTPRGFTSLVLIIVLLSGTVLLFLGVIGEYVGRIYEEVKDRPVYVIADRTGGQGG